jgi:proline racemase
MQVRATCRAGRVVDVAMQALPSFLGEKDVSVSVPGIGRVTLDLAFGGMWFAIVAAEQVSQE